MFRMVTVFAAVKASGTVAAEVGEVTVRFQCSVRPEYQRGQENRENGRKQELRRNCPCARYEGVWGSGNILPFILNLGKATTTLTRGKFPW
jgi:hypothetical protein